MPGPGRKFPKGQRPAGRAKGTVNKVTAEGAALASGMLKDERYRENLMGRLRRGTAGAMEVALWHYAYGKPKETVDLEHSGGIVLTWRTRTPK